MKLPFWATIFTLGGVIILCALGSWQLERLTWKQGIIAAIKAQDEPGRVLDVFAYPDFESPENQYKNGFIAGRYVEGSSFRIGPRTFDGQPGYHVITPFALEQGGTVLVNRGWVAQEAPGDDPAPQGRVELNGVLRAPDSGNMFTPPNQPADDIWYKIDIAQIEAAKNLENLPVLMLYGQMGQGLLEVSEIHKLPNNNHLQYAFFWFAMAGTLIVIYVLRFLRKE